MHGPRHRTALGLVAGAAVVLFFVVRSVLSRRTGQHGRGRPGPLRLRAAVTVNRSPHEAYSLWADFTRLPEFMGHLERVTVDDDGVRSHWTAAAPFGRTVEWDAELTGAEPGRRISWRSLPGSSVDNSGTVHFAPTYDGTGTEVSVVLHYDVPGGPIGRAVSQLFGEEPEQQVRDDLRRFKQVLETGAVVRSDALPDGTDAGHQLVQRPAQPAGEEDR